MEVLWVWWGTCWGFLRPMGIWLEGYSSFKRLEPWMSCPSVSDGKVVSSRHEVVHQLSWQAVQGSSFQSDHEESKAAPLHTLTMNDNLTRDKKKC